MCSRLNPLARRLNSPLLIAGGLLLLALLVRLPYLGRFITIDEIKWVEGAGQFLLALAGGDLAQTYWHFHPGITITWGEAVILWLRWLFLGSGIDLSDFVAAQLADLPSLIGSMRLSGVLLTAAAVPGAYLLARRLIDPVTALLGALLLAFDPFFTAHSRIVNGDAGAAVLMFLAVLAFLRLRQEETLRWAIISGILGGLALLTKLPSPILIPWIGLLALGGYRHRPSMGFWGRALLGWGLAAGLTVLLLWPALWVAPLSTLQLAYHDSFEVGEVGEGHETFFRQQISDDPGWLFYPVAILFRLTPVTSLGLVLIILWLIFGHRQEPPSPRRWVSWTLLAYILFIVVLASGSPKKLDRYVMGVIPPLVFLAATGFTQLGAYLAAKKIKPFYHFLGLAALAGLQLAFLLLSLPYYLTYYNPLLGGVSRAAAQVPVGWGEGLEQAATWLNAQPGAANLRVSAWYNDAFQPYFAGQEASFSDDGRAQLAADYVVFYINQRQRQKPYTGLVDYFRAGKPEFVVGVKPGGGLVTSGEGTLPEGTIPWVEVYKAPAAQSASGAPKVEGVAQLLAYKIEGGPLGSTGNPIATATSDLLPENQLSITLFLRVLGPLPDDTTITAALIDGGERRGGWEFVEMRGIWETDQIVEWRGDLTLPADLSPAEYKLWAAFQFKDGPVIAEFPISDKDPLISLP